MGSANGRHRRPRQAPAIVVAAGVTGSAIAIPLLGAAGAHAADASTWDRVAECESGGMWSADLGNGSYGGLQFSPELWKAYGGESYAERADLASRSQQIAVAEKVLADRGPKAWPSCAVVSGLATDTGLPGVDPGGLPSDQPSADPSGSASVDPSAEAGATDDASADGKGDQGDNGGKGEGADASRGKHAKPDASASPSATPSAGAGDARDASGADASGAARGDGEQAGNSGQGGKHRGAPAPEETRRTGTDGDRDTGRHTSRGTTGARDAGVATADGTYTVRTGDNLWAIAQEHELPGGWTALYETNKDEIGSDPDLILPGQSLDLGAPAE
ncbi:transglycosylase family protein [Streptomyces sp. NPDC059783]|uniref:transglycosylase family protein n=1 Tax=Streptomyces sp. NPDC059783 TaxID=3346944 RepID=UPI00365FC8F7